MSKEYLQQAIKDQEGQGRRVLEEDIASHVLQLTTELSTFEDSATMHKKFLDAACEDPFPLNSTVCVKIKAVRALLVTALEDFRRLQMWIKLQVPAMSDGNNFGVEVQGAILGQLSASHSALRGLLDSFLDYHCSRSGAVDKVRKLLKKNVKQTQRRSEKEDGSSNDGKEDKKEVKTKDSSHDQTQDETVNESLGNPDATEYIADFDTHAYQRLRWALEEARDHYLYAWDYVGKNLSRLEKPRGTGSASSMYGY